MKGSSTPGKSARTHIKGGVLGWTLAKQCAAAQYMKSRTPYSSTGRTLIGMDLLSGDGVADVYPASAETLTVEFASYRRYGLPAYLLLNEIAPATFGTLRDGYGGHEFVTVTNYDYTCDPRVVQWLRETLADIHNNWYPEPVMFLNLDPNSLEQINFPGELLNLCPEMTTIMVAIPANANGSKRSGAEKLAVCRARVEFLLKLVRPRHEGLLIWLNGDQDQWAYFITLPNRSDWCGNAEAMVKFYDNLWPHGISYVWYRANPVRFRAELTRLLTIGGSRSLKMKRTS